MRSGKTSLVALGLSLLSSCPLRSPALAIRGYWRGTITALNLLAPVQSCFSKLLAHPRYASKIAPCLVCASSPAVLFPDALATSGVGSVQPSSRSPRSPHLKSHSRQRRPTRLQVMTGNRGRNALDISCDFGNYLAQLFARYLA